MADVNLEQAKHIVETIDIPPQPATLKETLMIVRSNDPDLSRIAEIISKDVALSAAVIKTINSPFFGMRSEITSISQATMLLGMKNVVNIVTGLSLRMAMESKKGKTMQLGRFWDTATDTALVCASLAKAMRSKVSDDAYMFGLFHDCGIPLMQKKYADYFDTLKEANSDPERTFTDFEEDRYDTNHAIVGYIVARSWKLPKHICKAILEHHNPEILQEENEFGGLIAMLHMAEHISHSRRRLSEDFRWQNMKPHVLKNLMLEEDDYEELKDDVLDMMEKQAEVA